MTKDEGIVVDRLINSTDTYAEYVEVELDRAIKMCMDRFADMRGEPEFLKLVSTILGQSLFSSYSMIFIMRGKTTYVKKVKEPGEAEQPYGLDRVKRKMYTSRSRGRLTTSKGESNGSENALGKKSSSTIGRPPEIIPDTSHVTQIPQNDTDNARGNELGQERPVGQGREHIGDKDGVSGDKGKPGLSGDSQGQP
jgi:hypothetical protein